MTDRERPWGQLGPLGQKRDFDPTQLPGARLLKSYSVAENDLHFTVYYDEETGKRRLFVAELPDSVHVVVAFDPQLKPGYSVAGEANSWSAEGMLNEPLADRPIVDASRGATLERIADPSVKSTRDGAETRLIPPLFVSEYPGDLDCFLSEADLLGYIEPWFPAWVPEYEAYDSRGLRLELVTDAPLVSHRALFGLVGSDNAHELQLLVRAAEEEPTHQAELRSHLVRHLEYPDGAPSVATDATLEELVGRVAKSEEEWRARPTVGRRAARRFRRLFRSSE